MALVGYGADAVFRLLGMADLTWHHQIQGCPQIVGNLGAQYYTTAGQGVDYGICIFVFRQRIGKHLACLFSITKMHTHPSLFISKHGTSSEEGSLWRKLLSDLVLLELVDQVVSGAVVAGGGFGVAEIV